LKCAYRELREYLESGASSPKSELRGGESGPEDCVVVSEKSEMRSGVSGGLLDRLGSWDKDPDDLVDRNLGRIVDRSGCGDEVDGFMNLRFISSICSSVGAGDGVVGRLRPARTDEGRLGESGATDLSSRG